MKTPASLALPLFCAGVLLSGCTSLQTVPPANLSNLTSVVHVGDTVVCTMRNGRPLTFKVTTVEPDFIVGESRRFYVTDFSQLEVRRLSAGKTVLLAAGVATGGAAVATAAADPWLRLAYCTLF